MHVDEFGLTSQDRAVQRQRRMVLEMGERLPRVQETRWSRLRRRWRAWLHLWFGRGDVP